MTTEDCAWLAREVEQIATDCPKCGGKGTYYVSFPRKLYHCRKCKGAPDYATDPTALARLRRRTLDGFCGIDDGVIELQGSPGSYCCRVVSDHIDEIAYGAGSTPEEAEAQAILSAWRSVKGAETK